VLSFLLVLSFDEQEAEHEQEAEQKLSMRLNKTEGFVKPELAA